MLFDFSVCFFQFTILFSNRLQQKKILLLLSKHKADTNTTRLTALESRLFNRLFQIDFLGAREIRCNSPKFVGFASKKRRQSDCRPLESVKIGAGGTSNRMMNKARAAEAQKMVARRWRFDSAERFACFGRLFRRVSGSVKSFETVRR